MTSQCAAFSSFSSGIASNLIGGIDCFVRGDASTAYARFAGPGSPFSVVLTVSLTLYIALIGYRLILGAGGLALRNWAPRAFLMGGVLALTTGWSGYQTLVYNVLTDGPAEIASWANPEAADPRQPMARVDALTQQLLDVADAWGKATQAAAVENGEASAIPATADGQGNQPGSATGAPLAATPSAISGQTAEPTSILVQTQRGGLGPDMLLASALLLLLASAGVLAVAKVLLALLLVVGPLFLAMALFDNTRGLAVGWARAAVSLAIIPLFTLLVTTAVLAFLEPMVVRLAVEAASDSFSLRTATAILVAVLVATAVSLQLFRLSQTMIGAWSFLKSNDGSGASSHVETTGAGPATIQPALTNERIQTLLTDIQRGANNAQHGAETPRILVPVNTVFGPPVVQAHHQGPDAVRSVDGGRIRPARPQLRSVRSR